MKGDVGDRIIASAILALAVLLILGLAGVPFMIWIAELAMVAVGILMVRGDLGAHAGVGYALIVAGPALFILPGFFPALSFTLPLIAALLLAIAGLAKLFGTW